MLTQNWVNPPRYKMNVFALCSLITARYYPGVCVVERMSDSPCSLKPVGYREFWING